mgnify:CR=1 FL=1
MTQTPSSNSVPVADTLSSRVNEMAQQIPDLDDKVELRRIMRISAERKGFVEDGIIRESPLTIYVNKREILTMLCTPADLEYLTVGFLWAEGMIQTRDDITKIVVSKEKGMVWVEIKEEKPFIEEMMFKRLVTSGCAKGATFYNPLDAALSSPVQSDLKVLPQEIFSLALRLQKESKLFQMTGGVHGAALCDREKFLFFSEDIGRHNAVDKVFGYCFLNDIDPKDKILVSSGRLSSEIVLKASKREVPIVVSQAAPTDLSVRLSEKLGITLIGFVRGKRMNVYTHENRIASP